MSSDKNIIQYIPHHAIDKKKWDACIRTADNGLIYGYSFYLDHMAPLWDALVLEDYEAVMPLPWRKKAGLKYLYHPPLMAQLGIFGKNISGNKVNDFLHAVPKNFLYWDFPLNYRNQSATDFQLTERSNFILPMQYEYDQLQKNFKSNLRREIKKAQEGKFVFKKNIDEQTLFLFLALHAKEISKKDMMHFQNLYLELQQKGMAKNMAVFSVEDKLLSAAIFLFSHGRAYYVLAANHPDSRKSFTSHLLLNNFIQMHAGEKLLLDFEGSDHPGIAAFFKSFGAVQEKYTVIKLNRLPWWIKWLKR